MGWQGETIGTTFSSADPATSHEVVEHPVVHLCSNDPEPGYLPRTYDFEGEILLQVSGTPSQVEEIDAKLRAAGIDARILGTQRR